MAVVKSLNPTGTIHATDLGIPVITKNGHEAYFFGDSFRSDGQAHGPRWDGGPTSWTLTDWRSPTVVTTSTPVTDPRPEVAITIDGHPNGDAQLWGYPHANPEFSTVLPCDAVTVNGRIFLWVMVTQGLGNERWMELWSSDNGVSGPWTNRTRYGDTAHGYTSVYQPTDHGGMRRMLTWDRSRNSDFVYAMGTGGLKRDKGLTMYRVHKDWFNPAVSWSFDPAAWDNWTWTGNSWGWSKAPASIILPAARPGSDGGGFGELSLRWIQGHWVLSGFEASSYSMFVKIGGPVIEETNWMTCPTYRPVRGSMIFPPWGYDIIPNLYGGYTSSLSRFSNPDGTPGNFRHIVSSWLPDGSDYAAKQVTVGAYQPTSPVILTDPNPATRTNW